MMLDSRGGFLSWVYLSFIYGIIVNPSSLHNFPTQTWNFTINII